MPQCPNCDENITYLNFEHNTSGWESGTIYLPRNKGDKDYSDGETTNSGKDTFTCPHCDYELTDNEIEELEEELKQSNPQTNNTPSKNKAEGEGNRFEINPQYKRFRPEMGTGLLMVECPHCQHTYEDELTPEMFCPRCNKAWAPPKIKKPSPSIIFP